MRVIYSYLRLTLFIFGVLAGVQVPHFVDQYGKSLQSHYLESQRALDEFQQEADRYFDGDIKKLIAYYQASDDEIFNEGGNSISAIYQRNQQLQRALTTYRESLTNAYWQTFVAPQTEIRSEVIDGYNYAIQLTPRAIGIGLLLGFMGAVLIESLLRLLMWPLRRRKRQEKLYG